MVGRGPRADSCDHQRVSQRARDFYAAPGRHTDVVDHEIVVADIAHAVDIVQGLVVYDMVANDLYDAELSERQAAAIHLRNVAEMFALAREIDDRPLTHARAPASRIGGRCNTFTVATVALLRAAGIPARSRCGFGTYFVDGWYEDHWVAEYWNHSEQRWVMIDAQLDETWCDLLGWPRTTPVEVSGTQFVTAGRAWQAWRRGELDAERCGLTSIPEHGAFWIAGNLRLDFAALNKVEMLPWDVWGLFWEPGDDPSEAMLATFDEIAALTVHADDRFDQLRDRYRTDDSLRMDGDVFSAALGDVVHVP